MFLEPAQEHVPQLTTWISDYRTAPTGCAGLIVASMRRGARGLKIQERAVGAGPLWNALATAVQGISISQLAVALRSSKRKDQWRGSADAGRRHHHQLLETGNGQH